MKVRTNIRFESLKCKLITLKILTKLLTLQGDCITMQLPPNPKLLEHLNDTESEQSLKVKEFLLALAVCNTVVVATHPHHDIVSYFINLF